MIHSDRTVFWFITCKSRAKQNWEDSKLTKSSREDHVSPLVAGPVGLGFGCTYQTEAGIEFWKLAVNYNFLKIKNTETMLICASKSVYLEFIWSFALCNPKHCSCTGNFCEKNIPEAPQSLWIWVTACFRRPGGGGGHQCGSQM